MRGSSFLALSLLLGACEHPSALLTVTRARAQDPNPILAFCVGEPATCSNRDGGADLFPDGATARTFGLFGGDHAVGLLFRYDVNASGECLPVDLDGPEVDVDVVILPTGAIEARCLPATACAEITMCP